MCVLGGGSKGPLGQQEGQSAGTVKQERAGGQWCVGECQASDAVESLKLIWCTWLVWEHTVVYIHTERFSPNLTCCR